MTITSPMTAPLDVDACRALPAHTKVMVADTSGRTIETVTVMRYGGFYRDSGVHTFAVRDPENKFALRSAKELGLDGGARRCMVIDDAIDLTDSRLNLP